VKQKLLKYFLRGQKMIFKGLRKGSGQKGLSNKFACIWDKLSA